MSNIRPIPQHRWRHERAVLQLYAANPPAIVVDDRYWDALIARAPDISPYSQRSMDRFGVVDKPRGV